MSRGPFRPGFQCSKASIQRENKHIVYLPELEFAPLTDSISGEDF